MRNINFNMENVIGKYKLTYSSGISNEKDLIRHDDFVNIIKPTTHAIGGLDSKRDKMLIGQLKGVLNELFGDNWFTDESPLYNGIETGILVLHENQGGEHKYKAEKL